jgi:hypothetical protein
MLGRESWATVTAGRKGATVVGGTDSVQTLEIDGHIGQDRQDSLEDMVTEDTNTTDYAMEKQGFESCETGLKQDSDVARLVDTNTCAIEMRTTGMMEESSHAGTCAEEPRGGEEGFFLVHSQPLTGTENAKDDDQISKRTEGVKMRHTSVSMRQVGTIGEGDGFPGLPRIEGTGADPFQTPATRKKSAEKQHRGGSVFGIEVVCRKREGRTEH